ncbi:PilZ domain-containing protein [Thalassotalea sp. G2M2-11]|uniref:flagellar brake domain-containing protein n=1 Tax=Thalassotalea sp. G2M2-11 TaxID=2787627 RepID=UPI0019D29EE3|nr:PilZ domain-containing protein [Thalassotalea sp. G2M2-11]
MSDIALQPLSQAEKVQDLFELMPGQTVDLQINHPVQVRLKLVLVGYEQGKYIILKYPNVVTPKQYNDVLVEGNVAVVRYLLEGDKGCCFAFKSSIRHITLAPEKFIILSYPEKIENRQLRTHQRITTHLPAAISLDEPAKSNVKINGIIADLSLKGCGFTFKAENASTLVKQREVFVCISHYAIGEMRIPAVVCNSRNIKGRVNVGISFKDSDKQVASLLEHLFIDTSLI